MLTREDIMQMGCADKALAGRLLLYMDAFVHEEYITCLDMCYPRLWEIIPRDKMKKAMAKAFHDPSMLIKPDLFSMDQFSKMISIEEGDFLKISYTLLMAVQFREDIKVRKTPLGKQAIVRQQEKKEFMLNVLENAYGKDNIWYEEHTKAYCFHMKKNMLCLRDAYSPEWTFITITDHPMLEKFIPASVKLLLMND